MAGSFDANRILGRLGRSAAVRGEVGRALIEGARRVQADAKARLKKIPGGGAIDVTIARRGDLSVDIVATGPNAAEIEHGGSGTIAQPYLRPAAEARRAEINELIARAVRKAII